MKKYKSDLAICEWINRQFKDVDSKWLWCDHEKNQMFLEDENSYIFWISFLNLILMPSKKKKQKVYAKFMP